MDLRDQQGDYPAGMQKCWENTGCLAHVKNILGSYHRLLGEDFVPSCGDFRMQAKAVFEAPFVLVAHGIQSDPVLSYGNAAALRLWEMEWDVFTQTPSRFTAEAPNREERARLLAEVTAHGFIRNYSGVRISRTGIRFRIERATVWNVFDEGGDRCGQAAMFADWTLL